MEGAFEDKVQGVLLFLEKTSKREIAEFIVYQNDAVDGLRKNLDSFIKAFREMYNQSLDSDG